MLQNIDYLDFTLNVRVFFIIGWHNLFEEEYQEKLKEHEDKDNEAE